MIILNIMDIEKLCVYGKCTNVRQNKYHYCETHKCNVISCEKEIYLPNYNYCISCICASGSCNNLKFSLGNMYLCEECAIKYYYKLNYDEIINKCKYDSCNTTIIPKDTYCTKHICTFVNNRNMKCNEKLHINDKCESHMYWRPENHLEYSYVIQKNTKKLLFVLKRYEKTYGTRVPKFIKYEIIKYLV